MEINAATKVKKVRKPTSSQSRKSTGKKLNGSSKTKTNIAPPLNPLNLATVEQVNGLKEKSAEEQEAFLHVLFKQAIGIEERKLGVPTENSNAQRRGQAAADLAEAVKAIGVRTVLKEFSLLDEIEKIILPVGGMAVLFGGGSNFGMKRISSGISLASFAEGSSIGSDTAKTSAAIDKLKTSSVSAREGVLMILRALCEKVGKPSIDAYVVPFFGPILEETGSSIGAIREAASDTAKALLKIAHPLSTSILLCPVIFAALESPEWRVKYCALQMLSQLAVNVPQQVCMLLPKIIPVVSGEVFDTKPQVAKAAGQCLLAVCETNQNPDVKPAIPAVVKAIIKPADTTKAIEKLMGTTFVASVDASTLSILCPVLSRGLKEKLAIHKRASSIVIENMSRLVDSPKAVAPFGPLLVPDLKKVSENVQFEEIRDAALAALKTLTKALGHSSVEDAFASIMVEESKRAEEEEKRIAEEREAERIREEEMRKKEEEERRLWKEAQEAQRLLDKMALEEEEKMKIEKKKKEALSKQSVKSKTGKCKGCGLKKCKKDCLFRS